MSNRERRNAIPDTFSDVQLGNIADLLQAAKDAIIEADDDAFCYTLYEEHQSDPDKGEFMTEEDLCRELGITV